MRIFVCVKQVPDTSGKVAVKEDGTLDRASMLTIINPRISTTTSFDNTMKEEILNKSSSLREAISTRNVIRIRP